MQHKSLPPSLSLFLRDNIESVGQLEILLLLHAASGGSYSAAQINDEVRGNITSVEHRLTLLIHSGMAAVDTSSGVARYRYAPASEAIAANVDLLVEMYRDYRVRVIDAIYAAPSDRLRRFSEAFRIKKDGNNG